MQKYENQRDWVRLVEEKIGYLLVNRLPEKGQAENIAITVKSSGDNIILE